jgi:hypothetical protein
MKIQKVMFVFNCVLVIVDKYSRYIWVKKLSRPSTGDTRNARTICKMQNPAEVITDRGPVFIILK